MESTHLFFMRRQVTLTNRKRHMPPRFTKRTTLHFQRESQSRKFNVASNTLLNITIFAGQFESHENLVEHRTQPSFPPEIPKVRSGRLFRCFRQLRRYLCLQGMAQMEQIPKQYPRLHCCCHNQLPAQSHLDVPKHQPTDWDRIREVFRHRVGRLGHRHANGVATQWQTEMELLPQQSLCRRCFHALEFLREPIVYVRIDIKSTWYSKSPPPMSFQGGLVRWLGIYRRRLKKQRPCITASSGIDPMPLPTSLRGDDIPVEACNNQCRSMNLLGHHFSVIREMVKWT